MTSLIEEEKILVYFLDHWQHYDEAFNFLVFLADERNKFDNSIFKENQAIDFLYSKRHNKEKFTNTLKKLIYYFFDHHASALKKPISEFTQSSLRIAVLRHPVYRMRGGKKSCPAREAVEKYLERRKLLLRRKNITHSVKCSERSGATIEIRPTPQWFVSVLKYKEEIKRNAEKIHWHPPSMKHRLDQWVDGLTQDWCISRQRCLGVLFPAWHRKIFRKEKVTDILSEDSEGLDIQSINELYSIKNNLQNNPIPDVDLWVPDSEDWKNDNTETFFPVTSSCQDAWFTYYKKKFGYDSLEFHPYKNRAFFYKQKQETYETTRDLSTLIAELRKREKEIPKTITEWHEKARNHTIKVKILCTEETTVLTHVQHDVMDTWFTSSVSPQINAHAINDEYALPTSRFSHLFPADLRPQSHEIIRTWAFYTLLKAILHNKTIPWKDVMISGWCLARNRKKMSKSKGNVVTPQALIQEQGADIVRYWASNSRLGVDTAYTDDVFRVGKRLVTKLWNASRFVLFHLEGCVGKEINFSSAIDDCADGGAITEALDRWILVRMRQVIEEMEYYFDQFEYCRARESLEEFFWKDFCDYYLEMVKARAYGKEKQGAEGIKGQLSAQHTMYYVVECLLRLFAPFLPYITETLYQMLSKLVHSRYHPSIHGQGMWPKADSFPQDKNILEQGAIVVELLRMVHKKKTEAGVSVKCVVERMNLSLRSVEEREAFLLFKEDFLHTINLLGTLELTIQPKDQVQNTSDIDMVLLKRHV